MARTITLLDAFPVTIKPPISALSPVRTRNRVEMLRSFVVAAGVAVGVGIGVGVGVALGVAVAVATGVAVAVAVGAPVAVAVGVGVGVTGCTSNEPTSIRPPTTRGKPVPR